MLTHLFMNQADMDDTKCSMRTPINAEDPQKEICDQFSAQSQYITFLLIAKPTIDNQISEY